jgi:hypothetical protein
MNKVIKISVLLSLLMVAGSAVAAAPARVPATGEAGGATGSDKGVAWISPRFVEGSGAAADCITDKLTGLMWPKNGIIGFEATNGGGPIAQPDYANTTLNLNQINWTQALTAVENMNTASTKLCGYSDWRLPNIVELKSLVNYGAASPADWLMYGTGSIGSANCSGACFSKVLNSNYWTSSTYASNTAIAWNVGFNVGIVGSTFKNTTNYVWPVRGGQ